MSHEMKGEGEDEDKSNSESSIEDDINSQHSVNSNDMKIDFQ